MQWPDIYCVADEDWDIDPATKTHDNVQDYFTPERMEDLEL